MPILHISSPLFGLFFKSWNLIVVLSNIFDSKKVFSYDVFVFNIFKGDAKPLKACGDKEFVILVIL